MEYKHKLDSKLVTIASGTAANTLSEVEFSPDESFDEVIGVEAHEVADGGSAYYQLGVKDDEKEYLTLTHKNAILTNASVAQPHKFRGINANIRKGRTLKLRVKNSTLLSSDLKVEFVFTLRKTVTETR